MIYPPAEDSFLMFEILKQKLPGLLQKNPNLKFLEIGAGSGIHLQTAKTFGVKNISSSDIDNEAVCHCKSLGFSCIKSNLFKKIKERFDLIIFNPPYLPEDLQEPEESQLATTGGKQGSEVINRFLKQAKKNLSKDGKIFLLVSNLTKGIKWGTWKKKKVGEKKVFMELLKVYELTS